MIELSDSGDGLRALAHGRTALHVRMSDWSETAGSDVDSLPAPADAAATGRVRELRLPAVPARLTALDSGRTVELAEPRALDLDGGAYLLTADADLTAVVRFDAPASVRWRSADEGLRVTFPRRNEVALGFRTRRSTPTTVTVPRTPAGLARAVTHAASALRTTGPDRSSPSMRDHPPLIALGDPDVPASVVGSTPDTGLELRTPASLDAVFAAAPLAYYLGAELSVAEGATPHLRARDGEFEHALAPLDEAAPALLRRTFWLDCLIRDDGDVPLAEADLLANLPLDPAALRGASSVDRLRAYLDAPFEAVDGGLPDWHLAMYVDPTFETARSLPFLLDRLATIHPPRADELNGRELMKRSLDDFYRGPDSGRGPEVTKPRLAEGRLHGWLAPGTPIDVFKAAPEAYEHRLGYLRRRRDVFRATVVCNDPEMVGEDVAVAAAYRARDGVSADVTRHRDLTRAELADVFASENRLVHYVGHCEDEGLQCADGYLSIADVEESNAETFFLNACGSYREGRELVRKGSVAGAVTYRDVLDDQAATVGATFARLVVDGFSIERAVGLARRRIMMGKDYAVVGDGTHSIESAAGDVPTIARVDPRPDGFALTCEGARAGTTGDDYRPGVREGERYLCGNAATYRLGAAELRAFLERADLPVIYDGTFYWSDEFASAVSDASDDDR